MATDPKRKSVKSETLTIRLDPKTRFMLEFISRLRGQTITTVVERAISDAADRAEVEFGNRQATWREFWNVSDGVRALNLARVPALYPTYEEEKLFSFAMEHRIFFMAPSFDNEYVPSDKYMDLLWPKIKEYQDLWDRTKHTDYWAAGEEMKRDILNANVQPPAWPPRSPISSKNTDEKPNTPNDDIPF